MCDLSFDCLAGWAVDDILAIDQYVAPGAPAQAGDRLGKLALAVACHARDAHDLARTHLQ